MGKRLTGAKLRSSKRGKEAAYEIVETKAVDVGESGVTNKPDEELFVLDTTAIVPSKKQQQKKEDRLKRKNASESASTKEQTQIQKLVDTHSVKTLNKLVKKTAVDGKRAPKNIKGRQVRPTYDLWDDADDNVDSTAITKAATRAASDKNTKIALAKKVGGIVPSEHMKFATKKALPAPTKKEKLVTVDIARSGQSYNPDRKEHKSAIEEALIVETKRQQAEKEANTSASQGMSAETKALLLGDSDTEDEDENQNGEEDDDTKVIQKRPEKFTRAQRNKQKRVRIEQYEIQERKRQKRVQHEQRGTKSKLTQLKKDEAKKKEEKEKLELLKIESERSKGKNVYQTLADQNPRYAPTYPVALPEELKSGTSLRTIKPKGSLVTDRMVSLMDRDMTTKKQLKLKNRVQGKKRKLRVRGKGYQASKEDAILG
jgi:nucleolar protein 53